MSKYNKIKVFVVIFFLVFLNQFLTGQDSGFYYKYRFNDFLKAKTKNKDQYLKSLKELIVYPAIARENLIEGHLKYLIINSGLKEPKLILMNQILYNPKDHKEIGKSIYKYTFFDEIIRKAFNAANAMYLNRNTEKYLTEFSVFFDLESYENNYNSEIIIKGKKAISIEKIQY